MKCPRHRPTVVYVLNSDSGSPTTFASISSGKVLKALGSACTDSEGMRYCVTAYVEYSTNSNADHPIPEPFRISFSLAEFAANHASWRKSLYYYFID